jgi:hypothetical protein
MCRDCNYNACFAKLRTEYLLSDSAIFWQLSRIEILLGLLTKRLFVDSTTHLLDIHVIFWFLDTFYVIMSCYYKSEWAVIQIRRVEWNIPSFTE